MIDSKRNALQQYVIEGMKAELKDAVYNEILNELVEEFKNDIEPHLKERFEKISVASIERFRYMYQTADEIQVLVKGIDTND